MLIAQDKIIYGSSAYSVTASSITDGKYRAEVTGTNSIRSNYTPAFSENFNRVLIFKFAINGKDNERAPGLDHRVYLNPDKGEFTTPVLVFGKEDPYGTDMGQGKDNPILPGQSFNITFRLDMRQTLEELNTKGFYTTYSGEKISKNDFNGVYIAGSAEPLTWDFAGLNKNDKFKLTDTDKDGIYKITLKFTNKVQYETDNDGYAVRRLREVPAGIPVYNSSYPLLNALYRMSIDEMLLDVRDDGAYMAGAKWTGVWTRDVSYSILLSLAIVQPDVCKTTLMAKVKNGMIIQDTGTGGAWPVSTDRMIWAVAAYEVYLTTGDKKWLKNIYDIISRSIEADLVTVFDPATGLVKGESSFLDWREQTYPVWMDPKDIYESKCLGTNAAHAMTYKLMAEIGRLLGKDGTKYKDKYESLKAAINKNFWMEEKGYYGQFIYGRAYPVLSPKSETLGEALTVISGVAGDRAARVIKSMPVMPYGSPAVYPMEKNIPPYHNNSVWPFVEAYKMWAARQVNNEDAVLQSISGIMRAAGLFLSNKENFVAGNGNCAGTEINSDRQLWSVAGSLSINYRVLFGMEFTGEKLFFKPFIPSSLGGKHTLTGLKFGKAVYDITVTGSGNAVSSFRVDGKEKEEHAAGPNMKGKHKIEIELRPGAIENGLNLTENYFTPAVPVVTIAGESVSWNRVDGAVNYFVYKNGRRIGSTSENKYGVIKNDIVDEYQVCAADKNGITSFLSEPVYCGNNIISIPLTASAEGIKLNSVQGEKHEFKFDLIDGGEFILAFVYSNGNGPVNTDNKCAVRTVYLDGDFAGTLVLPQRGTNDWKSEGLSNGLKIKCSAGKHRIKVEFGPLNNNMNYSINEAVIKSIQLMQINSVYRK